MTREIRYCTLHELQVLFSQINYDIASHEIKRFWKKRGIIPQYLLWRIKWSHNHRYKAKGYPRNTLLPRTSSIKGVRFRKCTNLTCYAYLQAHKLLKIQAFCYVKAFRLLNISWYFGGSKCLHLQDQAIQEESRLACGLLEYSNTNLLNVGAYLTADKA